jgi:uncharacterized OsmC-like protein
MSEPRHVEARWRGGLSAAVTARDHALIADEPSAYGGQNAGMMPTELFFSGLASCFCLAVAHVAAKRDIELPGLRVSVDAERVGRELRYSKLRVEVSAFSGDDDLAALVDRAKPFCWVSNMLADELEVSYVTTALDAPPSDPSDASDSSDAR